MKEKTHKNPHYKTFTTYRASKKYKKKNNIKNEKNKTTTETKK